MIDGVVLEFVNLFCAGMLAGAEFVVRYGLSAPLATLDEKPQIQIRQALIRRLRILVPAIFVPTAVSGIAVTVLQRTAPGFAFRCAGMLAVIIWSLITALGTVPINKAAVNWRIDAPPENWRAIFSRWERLDTARSSAAVLAFACFLTAVALRLAGA